MALTNIIPPEYRLYASTMLPFNKTGNIDESYFDQNFLNQLKDQVINKMNWGTEIEGYKYPNAFPSGTVMKGQIKPVDYQTEKNPKGYDKVYAHMVKVLRNALEIAQSKYNSTEFIVFLDMNDSSMKQVDITFAKTLIVVLENTFTDNLKYCIVKNAPRLFKIVYRLIYPFIDKVTRKKFMFEKKGKLNRIIINGIQK